MAVAGAGESLGGTAEETVDVAKVGQVACALGRAEEGRRHDCRAAVRFQDHRISNYR